MELLVVDTVDQAREKLIREIALWEPRTCFLPFDEAVGRVLACDAACKESIPAFDRSTVDGYAVVAQDTAGAGESMPVILTLAGSVEMGVPCLASIQPGQCVLVPTGGMLPEGADAMVMVEHTEPFASGVAIYDAVASGENVTKAGDDAQAGDVLLTRGVRLHAAEIGVLAAAGIMEVEVFEPLRMTIISTGDELIEPGVQPELGQVRDINTSALAAQAQAAGFEVVATHVCIDEEFLLEQCVANAMNDSDFVVVSGGSSQGEKDATARIIDRLASEGVLTHGLAIKPGKPTIIGADIPSRTILVGLPGHPVSAMMVFEMLLAWLAREFTGSAHPLPVPVVLTHNVPASPGKETLQLVKLVADDEQTSVHATPVWAKSGLITRLAAADAFIRIEHDREGLRAGETVFAHRLTS